ncbi:hypothetical protein H7J86_24430 [Mycobacterium hackensackense]|uniref:hypothetical protein n=1 Tax=Mycobacterium hackensackense TaxID=228909 RepID=UPI002265CA98|nr:hypothetical protein [Mycobacterium hackensackense]MCV7255315.1 hypothetical protein [Mycobacterium hackensackense]
MTNSFDDGSRWVVLGSRVETPAFLVEAQREMFREFYDSLPEDSSARALWDSLPKPPGWEDVP